MTIWFTSDLHFGHKNIISLANRPFSSTEEMDEELIKRWNNKVKPEDTIYDLGDFAFKNPKPYLRRLNGTLVRTKGNHDYDISEPYMHIISKGMGVDKHGDPVTMNLCHYSMRSWEKSHFGAWHLFGHHHGKFEPYGLSFDVGVDCWNYAPVSLEQVAEKMAKLEPIVDFRSKA